jgi:outer membrane protein assembly factor BamB
LGLRELSVTARVAPAVTMVVGSPEGALYLLRHTAGDGAVAIVERIDPITLEALDVSADLPGGPVWPGGMGVADDGSLHVVFGNHAHRLSPELQLLASRTLPRVRPYNSFVTLPDGHLVTKDFGGSRPGLAVAAAERDACELVVLDPDTLDVVAKLVLPEPSIARLSADDDDIYVVGDTSLLRVRWDGASLRHDDDFRATYRSLEGQTFGWDCVIAGGAAWFLDDGDGSEAFSGTLRGHGLSTAPLHVVRVALDTGTVHMVEVSGQEGGLVANPPVVDTERGIVVGYDSGNGVLAAFDADTFGPRWRRDQDHASHVLLYAGTGELVTGDHADVVILDIATGEELARADTGSGMQSVLFPAPGQNRDFYVCSFLSVARVAAQ